MTPEQKKAAEYAEILLAFSRGERLQYKKSADGDWQYFRADYSPIGETEFEFRVAPKPVERFAVVNDCGDIVNHFQTTERAERYRASLAAQTRIVHLREVTE